MALVFITYILYFLLEIATVLEIGRSHLKAWVKTLKDWFRELFLSTSEHGDGFHLLSTSAPGDGFYLGNSWNSGDFSP